MTASTNTQSAFATLKAQEEAFIARARSNGVAGKAWEVMFALRQAAEFLDWASELISEGRDIDDAEVAERVQWATSKIAEAAETVTAAGTAH